jgi:hypothetical protein
VEAYARRPPRRARIQASAPSRPCSPAGCRPASTRSSTRLRVEARRQNTRRRRPSAEPAARRRQAIERAMASRRRSASTRQRGAPPQLPLHGLLRDADRRHADRATTNGRLIRPRSRRL